MKTKIALGMALLGLALAPVPVQAQRNVDWIEAPELGRQGQWAIGTRYRELELPSRVALTASGTEQAARKLGLRFWYPAADGKGTAAVYRHDMRFPEGTSFTVVEQGIAIDAAPAAKGKFPLVVISHGFGGWSEHLSRLGEHLASRGYVVAAIDHRDMRYDTVPGFLLSFGKVLSDRSLDQQQVIKKLADPSFVRAENALASADASRLALIGYSMGGFGALGTSGAAYDAAGKPFAGLPQAARAQSVAVDAAATALIDSTIAFAPWGGQPDNRAWTAEGIGKLAKPTLFIAGDNDRIVNYREGVRWLFDQAKGSDRYLLVYREATHNIAGNTADISQNPSVQAIGYAHEPVWRQERLNQINQHFVTAFLDLTLKGEAAKRKYLDVPTPMASDGEWQVPFGTPDNGEVAGDQQPKYWRGFQRHWATGMELHRKMAGQ